MNNLLLLEAWKNVGKKTKSSKNRAQDRNPESRKMNITYIVIIIPKAIVIIIIVFVPGCSNCDIFGSRITSIRNAYGEINRRFGYPAHLFSTLHIVPQVDVYFLRDGYQHGVIEDFERNPTRSDVDNSCIFVVQSGENSERRWLIVYVKSLAWEDEMNTIC